MQSPSRGLEGGTPDSGLWAAAAQFGWQQSNIRSSARIEERNTRIAVLGTLRGTSAEHFQQQQLSDKSVGRRPFWKEATCQCAWSAKLPTGRLGRPVRRSPHTLTLDGRD